MSTPRVTPAFVGGPTGPGRAAPGPGGYVVAVVVADLVLTLLLTFLSLLGEPPTDPSMVGTLLTLGFFVLVVTTVASIPVGVVGVVLVHLLCRRSPRQAVHVLVAGVVGLLAGLAPAWVLPEPWDWWFPSGYFAVLMAVSTASGRWAVVREVRQAQQDFARARSLG